MKKFICLAFALVLCISSCLLVVACDKTEVADNTKFYDAITKTLKLKKSFTAQSSFLDDGIAIAEVDAFTDGDTTRFRTAADGVFSVRYYEIDTPESTGQVQKWGKAASNFTEKQLESAELIVLESSTGGKAELDSYKSRWLGYVWYKPKGASDFKCLNLELVENGFSLNQGNSAGSYPYNKYFDKAEDFARSIKLRIFSDLDDPLYSDDPIETSIKELTEELAKPDNVFYNPDTKAGAKVKIVAYLAELKINNTYTYVAEQYDPETGKVYRFNVYTMYSTTPASKMKLGHLYEIIGDLQMYGGEYQLSGITYSLSGTPAKNATTIKQREYFLTFDSTKAWFAGGQYSATLYSDITVTAVKYENGTLVITGTALQCSNADRDTGEKEYDPTPIEFTFTVAATQQQADTIVANTTVIRLQGYQLVKDSHEITIPSFSAIKVVQ